MKRWIFFITVFAFTAASSYIPLCAQNVAPSPTPTPIAKPGENPSQTAAQIPLPETSPTPSQKNPANATLPQNSVKPEAPPLIPKDLPAPTNPPPPSIPSAIANPTPPPSPEISYQRSETGKAVAQQKALIDFREAEILAKRDPQVRADWNRAQNSKTFEGQRAALRDYYTRLYALIAAKVPSLTAMSEARKTAAINSIKLRFKPRIPQDNGAANSGQYPHPAASVRH